MMLLASFSPPASTRIRLRRITASVVAAGLVVVAAAQDGGARRNGKGARDGEGRGEAKMPPPVFRTDVPARPFDLILGRPTTNAVTASILTYQEAEGTLAYGTAPDALSHETDRGIFPAGQPVEVKLTGLAANTTYHYEFRMRFSGRGALTSTGRHSFTTARPPGTPFTFTIQADPHLDFGIDPKTYEKSLANARAARPDFHLDLGDTFMVDKYLKFTDAAPQYLAQRYYFGLIGADIPVFLVLGNHDGETLRRGGDATMALWSNERRKRYFPNPEPNDFYTGNAVPHPEAGLLQNTYAWTWGDALFIALDQYWTSAGGRGNGQDNWGRTLGRTQYEWFRNLLARSQAKYTFVFIHHLVGGETPEGRGGAEASRFFEWGGLELDGRTTFAQKRPGWAAPLHDLLARRRGVIVFHGHDHLYAHQQRDGVIYQLVPQPGHSRTDNIRSAAEYGYQQGVIQGASGILRVAVAPAETVVEYVRAYPDNAENTAHRTGSVTHRFTVRP
jgi:hypothetical protein